MKKVIIPRRTQVEKTFSPPFFNNFILSMNRKKMRGNEGHKKETKHVRASAAHLLCIRIENWCKCGHFKNKAVEIDCLCFTEVDAMLIALTKIL